MERQRQGAWGYIMISILDKINENKLNSGIVKYSAPPLICQLWDLANCWQNRGVAN